MTYRVRNIAVAVGLALVAALLTTFYVANYKRHVQQGQSTVKVFVATRDIPTGTPGADLAGHGWIATADVAQRTVVPGHIATPEQIASLITTQPIFAGEQVTLRRFANQAELGVRAQLHGTLRALSLPGSTDQLLVGTLRDGDHVDLLASLKSGDCTDCVATRAVVRNLLVLRAPGSSPTGKASAAGGASVLLAVSDRKQEQKVFYTLGNAASWTLVLRPVAKAVDSREDLQSASSVLKDGLSGTALAEVGR
jgi:Flp pilus assembly protein CpaB